RGPPAKCPIRAFAPAAASPASARGLPHTPGEQRPDRPFLAAPTRATPSARLTSAVGLPHAGRPDRSPRPRALPSGVAPAHLRAVPDVSTLAIARREFAPDDVA